MLFISPPSTDVIDNSGNEATALDSFSQNANRSTYAVVDSAWKYQYDKYNDVYRWVPLNGDIAGLCARTDTQRDPWFSPAGLNRGQIKNVVKLSWNPTKTERDTIYKAGINPVVTFPGEGTILYGDKTFQNRPSAFDRINVRRLFLILEKTIAKAARSTLFEFNDEFTRAQFVNLVEPFLRDIQGRRGIYDYRVVCDTTNNTAEVIDQNQFVGDIYIKPARSINFIQLNFVAVRTGVAFNEIVGKF
jgi:phage tail sheath protein FI